MQYRTIFTLAGFLATTVAFAQPSAPRLVHPSSASLGGSFEYWSARDDRITELVLPLVVNYAFNERLNFTLINQPTSASLKRVSQSFTLNGLTDTRFGASYLFAGEKLLATTGISLPTGKTKFNEDELVVGQIIPLRELELRTNYFGGGLDFSLGLSAALPLNDTWVIGIGSGFVHPGPFTPIEGSGEYDPGEQLSGTVGFDRTLSEESKLLVDATYTLYTADTFQGMDYFKAGGRLLIEARCYFPWRRIDMALIARDRIQSANQSLQPDSLTNVLALTEEQANSHGNELEIAVQGSYSLSEKNGFDGIVQARIYSVNDLGTKGARIFGIGGGWRRVLSSVIHLELGGKFSYGSLQNQDGSTTIYGLEIHGGLMYKF